VLVNGIELLNNAKKEHYAIPQFNINNLEWTKYILEECERLKSPVILGVSEGAIKYMGGFNTVYNLVNGLINDLKITIPVILHLDHGKSVVNCKKAIENGFTSVMIDASNYSITENIKITKEVTNYAKQNNVAVEAEIGHIGGSEDNVEGDILYATVDDCVELIEATNINSLAPALGSVHGLYKGEPNLNFERMKEINSSVKVPLVLHGGTGIPSHQIKKSIKYGIAKININTELQIVWAEAVKKFIRNNKDVYDPRKIINAGEKAIKQKIYEKIVLFNSKNKV
jgi:fructose-bisphosphate aldolase class II